MERNWYSWLYLVFACVLVLVTSSSCGRRQDELPTTITATAPRDTATPTNTEFSPQPTQTVATQVVELEIGPVERAAQEFFDLIRQGEIEQALSNWDLHEEDARNFERIARDWHTQGLQFSVGEITYSGFAAPGDFQDLEEDDPRVSTASVEVSIGGQPYYLMLAKANGDWRMNGLLVR